MRNLIIILTLPLYFFCNFLQLKDLNGKTKIAATSTLSKNAKIVYLFFKVEKTNSGIEKITLEEKKIVDGKLKSNPTFEEGEGNVGDFVISMTNAGGKEIIKQLVEDPLNPSREVYSKDEISRNKISLENAEFSVRYSHSVEIQTVKIEKITSSGKKLVFTQKL